LVPARGDCGLGGHFAVSPPPFAHFEALLRNLLSF
jgi:hypothetical protein